MKLGPRQQFIGTESGFGFFLVETQQQRRRTFFQETALGIEDPQLGSDGSDLGVIP